MSRFTTNKYKHNVNINIYIITKSLTIVDRILLGTYQQQLLILWMKTDYEFV